MTSTRLRPSIRSKAPGLAVERELWASGDRIIAGVDEVGRGSWAGPLTVAAAVIPQHQRIYKVRDSKMLNEREREALYRRLAPWCVSWGIGHASAQECDHLGMSAAQRLAAKRAIGDLSVTPDRVLVDGKWDFVDSGNTKMIVGGDATSLTIAAASILAKVTRDRIMRALSPAFPGFDFERNKGYPCPRHRAALAATGPTPIHRTSWAFMDDLPWSGVRKAPVHGQDDLFAGAFA